MNFHKTLTKFQDVDLDLLDVKEYDLMKILEIDEN
jgi:hypothetical protein